MNALLFALCIVHLTAATDKTIYDDRFRFIDSTRKQKSVVELLHKRIGNDDFLYAVLGHPTDETINKQHVDSYKVFNQLLTAHHITSKGTMLNANMEHPHKKHKGSSYFTAREFTHAELGLPKIEIDPFPVDWDEPEPFTETFPHIGMCVHSWRDCIEHVNRKDSEMCVRVIQIRNDEQFYPQDVGVELMKPLFRYVKRHMDGWVNETQLIVFQVSDAFCNAQSIANSQEFHQGLAPLIDQFVHGGLRPRQQRIAAIMFTLMVGVGRKTL